MISGKIVLDKKQKKMEDRSNFKDTAESQDAISEVKVDIPKNNAKYYLERANQLMQEYYNKACGCSVKSKENNISDTKSLINEG